MVFGPLTYYLFHLYFDVLQCLEKQKGKIGKTKEEKKEKIKQNRKLKAPNKKKSFYSSHHKDKLSAANKK